MAKFSRTVSVYGTEQEFIEAVYDAFLEIDGVTMNPTKENISTIFADSSAKATFTVTYGGITFTFMRGYANSDTSNSYRVTVNNATISTLDFSFTSGGIIPSLTVTRTWKVALYSNSKAIKLILTNYNDNSSQYLFITYSSNGSDIVLYKPNTNVITKVSSLTLTPIGAGIACSTVNALNYVSPNSGVDTFDFTILKNTSGEKVAVIEGLKSCSAVSADTVLTINGKDNYSIGTDVLIEV